MSSSQTIALPGAVSQRGPRPALLVAALLPLLLFVGIAWFDHRLELDRTREHATATADALAEHAQKVVETADLVLARILDHVQALNWATIGTSEDVHQFLLALKHELPQLESAFLVSPEGINVASSRVFPIPHIDVSSREYFIHALEGGRSTFFSEPFKGQIAGTYAFTITRPRLTNGRFDGLVGVTISSPYFEAFYRAVAGQPGKSTAALIRDDGVLLVRFPSLIDQPVRVAPQSRLLQAASSGARSGTYTARSAVDGHTRTAAFRRLIGAPLLVGYGVDNSVYLQEWYLHLALFALLTALSSAAILYAGHLMLRSTARESEQARNLIEEITRRQKAEASLQQSQKMEALGRLTGGVAHDFNNLLAAILGSLELLARHVSEPRPARLLATARKAAERGAQITAQMLAFSRHQEIQVRAVEVNEIIRSMGDLLPRALGPAVRICYNLADELWPATADPAQLEVALLNLAVNARDAMPLGGDLTIATDRTTVAESADGIASGEYVRVSVSDTGEGMSEEVRQRAFEPFFTTKEPTKGTGLGLSMVFGFASSLGGSVNIESAAGRGTTISILLPRASATISLPPVPAADGTPVATVRAARILVVDDDETVRMTTRAMLEELGHQVAEADGGRAALRLLNADRQFRLILVDYAMPELSGSDLAKEVRSRWPDAPLLFVTGYVENEGLRGWTDQGVPTLRKPFTQRELASAVADALAPEEGPTRVIPLHERRQASAS
jgi:signal transduction histidine kinase